MRGVEVNTRGAHRSGRARPAIARVGLLAAGLALLAGLAYTSYGVVVGSDAIVHPGGSSDCRTPMVRYGWAYEAINYDMADDVLLQRANPTLRTGVNLLAANPIDAIPALGDRPLLLLHGTADLHDLPVRSVEANYQAARAAGVPVEMHLCPGATHGNVIDVCPDAWRRWSVGFLERAIGGT